jgi:hypothetical protein
VSRNFEAARRRQLVAERGSDRARIPRRLADDWELEKVRGHLATYDGGNAFMLGLKAQADKFAGWRPTRNQADVFSRIYADEADAASRRDSE